MAPIRGKRSNLRARAAKANPPDPRGRYAPPSEHIDSAHPADDDPSLQSTLKRSIKRKRDADDEEDVNWRLNKRDKRTIKHNVFLAKVRDSGVKKKPLKRRRPNKKLNTDISSLADALPDVDDDLGHVHGSEDEWEGVSDDDENAPDPTMRLDGPRKRRRKPASAGTKMVMKSLQHRPGAMKRKRKMEDAEMERFRRNLAQMASGAGTGPDQVDIAVAGSTTQRGLVEGATSAQASRWAALRGFIGATMQKDKAFAVG